MMAEDWLQQHRRKCFGKWIQKGQTLLEFGARDAWTLRALPAANKYVCAPRAEKTLFESAGIKVFENSKSLPDGCADLIICDSVLEYLPEPINELIEFRRVLRPGGVMVVHALYDPDFRHPRFDRPVEHYFSWNVQTMGNLLVDCGFDFVEGGVRRMVCEDEVLKRRGGLGDRFAELYVRVVHPRHQVCVAARQPVAN